MRRVFLCSLMFALAAFGAVAARGQEVTPAEKERARCFRSLDFISGAEKDAAIAELALGVLK